MHKFLNPFGTLASAVGFYTTFGILFPRIIGIPDEAEALSPIIGTLVMVITGGLVIKAILELSKISKDHKS